MYDSKSLGLNILYMLKVLSYIKMDFENMRVAELKALARERGLRGYSRLRKDALINFISDSERQPQPQQPTQPQRPMQPNQTRSVRFRPDRPRQLELMRRLEGIPPQPSLRPAPRPTPQKRNVEFKPYQLKTKKKEERTDPTPNGKETAKKLKRIKKKLNELNRKIRHSKKKNDGLIHKRNALRKAIESAKHGTEPKRSIPEPKFIFKEREQGFGGAYRSYRAEGVPIVQPSPKSKDALL